MMRLMMTVMANDGHDAVLMKIVMMIVMTVFLRC